MIKWLIVGLVILGLWYGLQGYFNEERLRQGSAVKYTNALQSDKRRAEDAVAKSQEAMERRMKEYQKGGE